MLQLHAPRNKRSKFVPVKNEKSVKPSGGFWTSTYTPERDYLSGWLEWCASEMPHWIPDTGMLYRVLPEARVLVIDGVGDMESLFDDYAEEDKIGTYRREYIDFERLATVFDGMRLTEEGQWRTRMTHPRSLHGWDCESTLWFRMEVLEAVGEIKLKVAPAEQPQNTVVAG